MDKTKLESRLDDLVSEAVDAGMSYDDIATVLQEKIEGINEEAADAHHD